MKCPDCDREDCPLYHLGDYPATGGMSPVEDSQTFNVRMEQIQRARANCRDHRVDWRERALAAEAQLAAAREAVDALPQYAEGMIDLEVLGSNDVAEANDALIAARLALGLEDK